MKKKGMVGLGRVVTHRRERLLMLQSRGKGIVATALRYKNEVRNEDEYFDEIPSVKIPADMIQLAEHILDSKKGHFDPSKFEDRYEDALRDLIKAKQAGKARADGVVAQAQQRHQPDGCAAPQREGRARATPRARPRRPAARGAAKTAKAAKKKPAKQKKLKRAS